MDIEKYNAVIAEFTNRLGVDSNSYDGCGVFEMSLNQTDRLYIEHCESGAVAYFGRQYKQLVSRYLIKLLQSCDIKRDGPEKLVAGMNGPNELMYIARIPERDMNAMFLSSMLVRFYQLHDALGPQ